MNLKWLLQSSGLISTHYAELFSTLQRQNCNVKDFGLISPKNLTNIENILEPDDFYIIRGGTRLLTVLNDVQKISECNKFLSDEQINNSDYYLSKLKSGIDYDIQKFDQFYYKDLNLPLLNSTSEYIEFKDCKDLKFSEDVFIKPSKDLKSFNGGILEKGTSIKEYILSGQYQKAYEDEIIILDKVKKINAEYRFFCIRDKIITGSLYRRNGKAFVTEIIPEYVMSVAKEYVKLYQPADIFVMDICELSNGKIKIVEYNCWNCSGFYNTDINKLINEISNYKLSIN